MSDHQYKEDAEVFVEGKNVTGVIGRIIARPDGCCGNNHPLYAVEISGDHWSICEKALTPIGKRN